MKQQLAILDGSLDLFKTRRLALLVSLTPLLSALVEPLWLIFFDSHNEFAPLDWAKVWRAFGGFILALLPRIALAHLLWKMLQPTSEPVDIKATKKIFWWSGVLRWTLWGILNMLFLVFVNRPEGDSLSVEILFVISLFPLVVGVVVVWFHQRLLVRVLEAQQTLSHDARSVLYLALLKWLFYMELYMTFLTVMTNRAIPFPFVLMLFAVVFCVLVLLAELPRRSQLLALRANQIEGYQIEQRSKVSVPSDVTLFPLIAGTPESALHGVLLQRVSLTQEQAFRSDEGTLVPVAYTATNLNESLWIVGKRISFASVLLVLHLAAIYLLVTQ